jgi:hypothetical protein
MRTQDTRRIFISTVSHEFLTCREQLAKDLRFPAVDVQTQEENIAKLAAGQTILLKLDDYIAHCDAVIHLIGLQTSKDGRSASAAAVDDILQRYKNLPTVLGLSEDVLRTLSYTQWEAWLSYYHRKTKNPDLRLIIATPTPSFIPVNPADSTTAHTQELSQAWHEKELKQRGHYSEISFADARDLSIAILRALKDILPSQQPLPRIAPTRLISRHATDQLLGREAELALLDDAWSGPRTTNLLSIIAWGGVGKTALLAYWVQDRFIKKSWLDEHGQPDPMAYFDWTFYDQGTRSDDATHAGAASVGSFWENALLHFGDAAPQNPQNRASRLAQRNPGLCLVSSRQPLSDFLSGNETPTRQHDLGELPLACAIALLQKMQIIGTEEELKEAAEDYFCHALSLIVLGRFLFVKGGDIRIRKQIPLERANDNRKQPTTRNAWHVLEAY